MSAWVPRLATPSARARHTEQLFDCSAHVVPMSLNQPLHVYVVGVHAHTLIQALACHKQEPAGHFQPVRKGVTTVAGLQELCQRFMNGRVYQEIIQQQLRVRERGGVAVGIQYRGVGGGGCPWGQVARLLGAYSRRTRRGRKPVTKDALVPDF